MSDQWIGRQEVAGILLMGPLYRPDPREREAVSVAGVVYDTLSLLDSVLNNNGTHVRLTGDRGLTVRLNRGHLMQVMSECD